MNQMAFGRSLSLSISFSFSLSRHRRGVYLCIFRCCNCAEVSNMAFNDRICWPDVHWRVAIVIISGVRLGGHQNTPFDTALRVRCGSTAHGWHGDGLINSMLRTSRMTQMYSLKLPKITKNPNRYDNRMHSQRTQYCGTLMKHKCSWVGAYERR